MKKNVLSVFLAALLLFAPLILFGAKTEAAAAETNNVLFAFSVWNDKAHLERCDQNAEGEIVVPETYEGYPVVSVSGLYDCDKITSIVIPASVEDIDIWNLSECVSLENITVSEENQKYSTVDGVLYNKGKNELLFYPAAKKGYTVLILGSVEKIDEKAFRAGRLFSSFSVAEDNGSFTVADDVLYNKDKTVLIKYPPQKENESFDIPSGVQFVETYAFNNCENIKSISTPNSLTEFSPAFGGCTLLETIHISKSIASLSVKHETLKCISVDEENSDYSSLNGVLYNKEKTTLLYYPPQKTDEEFNIPATVTEIKYLVSNYLKKINIPYGVTFIQEIRSPKLEELVLPDSVTELDNGALRNNIALKKLVLSKNLTEIGLAWLAGCESLTSLELPDCITGIGFEALDGCISLKTITVGKNFQYISGSGLDGCTSLTDIIIDPENPYLCFVDGVVFDKEMKTIEYYPAGKTDTVYTVPDGVKKIDYHAFYDNNYITEVNIPASVSWIASKSKVWPVGLFFKCNRLKAINVDDNNEIYFSEDGVLFENGDIYLSYDDGIVSTIHEETGEVSLHHYPSGKTEKSYTVPSYVSTVWSKSLRNCQSLTTLYFPSTVTFIDGNIINENEFLEDVYILNRTAEVYYSSKNSYSPNVTVHAYKDSTAEQWAKDCNLSFEVIEEHEHVPYTVPAVQATCIAAGKTEGKNCSVCGDIIAAQQKTAKTAHKWNSGTVSVAPTEAENGLKTFKCIICGTTRTESIPKLQDEGFVINVNESVKLSADDFVVALSGLTVQDIINGSNVDNIVSRDGKNVDGSSKISTGMKAVCKVNGKKNEIDIVIMGDVDGNGSVTVADARLALRGAVLLDRYSGAFFKAANVTGGETISVSDARKILRIAVALENGKDLLNSIR